MKKPNVCAQCAPTFAGETCPCYAAAFHEDAAIQSKWAYIEMLATEGPPTCAYCDEPLAQGESEHHAACAEAEAEYEAEEQAWKKEIAFEQDYPNHAARR